MVLVFHSGVAEGVVCLGPKAATFLIRTLPMRSTLVQIRLEAFYSRTKDHGMLIWIFSTVSDLYESGVFSAEHRMSVETLSGGTNSKGDIDMWLMKLKLHDYLLGSFLEKHPFSTNSKTQLREVFRNHNTYRAMLKPLAGTMPGLSWCAGWLESSSNLMNFIEEVGRGLCKSKRKCIIVGNVFLG